MKRASKQRRGILICFSGLDGSGKTTVVHGLLTALRREGVECKYVWARFESQLVNRLVVIFKRFVLRCKSEQSGTKKFSKVKAGLFRNHFAAALYTCFVATTYLWQILVKLWLPSISGTNIVCDRYIYDTMIDLAADLPYPKELYLRLLNIYLHFAPKPDLAFYIALPEEIAYSRKDDIPSLDYLHRRKDLYDQIAKQHNLITLDGSSSSEKVQNAATKLVLEYLRKT